MTRDPQPPPPAPDPADRLADEVIEFLRGGPVPEPPVVGPVVEPPPATRAE